MYLQLYPNFLNSHRTGKKVPKVGGSKKLNFFKEKQSENEKKNTEDAFFNYMVSAAVFQTQFQIYYSKENYLTSF